MITMERLVKGCVDHDVKCQQLFYERYYNYVFKIAFRYPFRYESVANVVNNGFVNLLQGINAFAARKYKDEQVLLHWIKKTIIKTIINELQRHNMVGKILTTPSYAWENFEGNENKENLLLYKELIMHLKSLAPAYNIVYNMYVIDGFSHKEIAALLHITEAISKSNLARAKASLEKLVKSELAYSTVLSH